MGILILRNRFGVAAVALGLAPASAATAQQAASAPATQARAQFDDAYYAWDEGRYVDALVALQALLASPSGESMLRQVATLTGEVHRTYELTADGAAPRWSPDGQYAIFETTVGGATVTRAVDARQLAAATPAAPQPAGVVPFAATLVARVAPVLEVRGHSLAFSPDGREAAYLRVEETPAVVAARAAVGAAEQSGDRATQQQARQRLEEAEAAATQLVLRTIAGGAERRVDTRDLEVDALLFGPGGALLAVAALPGESDDQLYRLFRLGAGAPVEIPTEAGPKQNARIVSGSTVMYGAGRGGFALVDATSGRLRSFEGGSPAAARNGAIVFLGSDDGASTIEVLAPGATEPSRIFRTTTSISSPAISPDGRRVAFEMTPREDREIYVLDVEEAAAAMAALEAASAGAGAPAAAPAGRGGRGGRGGGRGGGPAGPTPTRVTTEIQHDLFPQFAGPDDLLAVMGEGRHRRSYLYDLTRIDSAGGDPQALAEAPGGAQPYRLRLFHNNTVRTVAPEYGWVLSPDGSKLLVVAERDGDTVSPERGVYLMDLSSLVTKDEVAARVAANLRHEQRLRAAGQRMFEPIAPAVRDVVGNVSTARIYGYAADVYQFGSKFITQPGNAKAIEYYAAQLRSMGYDPELQWFEARGVRTANVIAKLPGTVNPELIYVVSSHFDSVERGPGADDDSSGATALLEAARVLKDHPQSATIHFAFFTGEEAGLLGSREYVRRAVERGDRIAGALNNDMIGFANDQRLDNTIRYSNDGIRDVQHAAAFLFTNLITFDAKYYKSTDAAAYYDAYGDIVGGIGSYPILGNPHYHQSHDVLETINQQLVAEVSKTTAATLMLLANSPARLKDLRIVSRSGGNAVIEWTPAPESGIVEYVIAYGTAENPERESVRVREARATVRAPAGSVLSVKAVNQRGMLSWDWARVIVE